MTRLSIMFTLSLALAACGSKPATTTTPKADATTTFELGELTLFEGPDAMVKIHADGTSEIGGKQSSNGEPAKLVWNPGPSFKADGTLEVQGKAVGKLNADGTITDMEHGKPVPATVTADGVTFEKGSITLGADGAMTITGGNGVKPEKALRVAGADTPGKRRVVLTLVALLMGGEPHEETAPAVESPAAAPKP